jgi:hypothetical protein
LVLPFTPYPASAIKATLSRMGKHLHNDDLWSSWCSGCKCGSDHSVSAVLVDTLNLQCVPVVASETPLASTPVHFTSTWSCRLLYKRAEEYIKVKCPHNNNHIITYWCPFWSVERLKYMNIETI